MLDGGEHNFREFIRDFWDEKIPWDEVRWTDPRILVFLIATGTRVYEAWPHVDPRIREDLRDHLMLWMRELPGGDSEAIRERLTSCTPPARLSFSDEAMSSQFRRRTDAFESVCYAYALHRSSADAIRALMRALLDADGALDAEEVAEFVAPLVELMSISAAVIARNCQRTDVMARLRSAPDIGSTLRLALEVLV